MLRILLTCSGGMSSAMVVNALIKEGKNRGLEIESKAVGTADVAKELDSSKWDGILVAPQVRHMLDGLRPTAESHGVPIVAIKPQAYSPLGAKFLMEHLKEMNLID
ncbi:PTS sugar transporter subunit IIB [Entomospira nematocerorum]|uniref:PTS sugar transporter subunit IIB n=1 Tax=Entomospira nematocerorum TaxID=2719987 RepID=A0A968GCN3_9SPIO|nr:PTS sugar transporter subunit IIB [Entomospira nematocera]NIZ46794.1 PTS sugar transporter subunit IIB [Entomospira nematocera]WDI33409.1 PTS sugar transporter subunit IIB [Entomospira nematocera]